MSIARESFNFSPEFQDLVLACLVKEPKTFAFLMINLKSRHFTGLTATIVAEALTGYFGEYAMVPSLPMLQELAREKSVRIGADTTEVDEYMRKLDDMDTKDWRAVKEKLTKFITEREVLACQRRSLVAIQEGKPFDYIGEFTKALNVCKDMSELGLLFDPTDAEATVRKITSGHYGVKCGYPLIDKHFPMGFGQGWLVVPLAPPKTCKTTLCLNFAYNQISPAVDCDVIYNTNEISQELALMRELCRMVRLPIAAIFQNPELFIQTVNREFARKNFRARLLFKGWPADTATISDMEAHCRIVQGEGLDPKAMYIDYAETVKPQTLAHAENLDRRLQASIYTHGRAMADNRGLTLFMPDRCNAETTERAVPNMKSFQGAFQKGGIVDVAFGICVTEQEWLNKVFRLFFFLNRHGPCMQYFRGQLDLENYRLEVNEELQYVPEDNDEVAKSERRKQSAEAKLPKELQE